MTSFVSAKLGQFHYFDAQLGKPDWRGKKVLDFGGNIGNLLRGSGCTIEEDNYWCIDVSRDALVKARKRYPNAHWIFYNRHNFEFNPNGVHQLPIPDSGERFDYIVAYSVFTHTSKAEMVDLVRQLEELLRPRGVLAFTFLDPDWMSNDDDLYPGSNLRWRLLKRKEANPEVDVDALESKGRGAEWCSLINDVDLYLNDEPEPEYYASDKRAYITLCTPAHMRTIFPGAEILPPARPERHHCCVIRKGTL